MVVGEAWAGLGPSLMGVAGEPAAAVDGGRSRLGGVRVAVVGEASSMLAAGVGGSLGVCVSGVRVVVLAVGGRLPALADLPAEGDVMVVGEAWAGSVRP